MLKKRITTSIWGILILIAAVWFDQPLPWFTGLVALFGLLAAREFYRLGRSSGASPLTGFGLLWVLLFILSPHFDYGWVIPSLLISAVVLPAAWLMIRHREKELTTSWVWTVVGILYLGWLLSLLVALRGLDNPQTPLLDEGRNWVFFALFTTFISDIAAFFVGRALGRHHLAPRVSPNKTWEGAIAGTIAAVLFSLLFLLPTPLGLPLDYGQAMLVGLGISVFGQLGDLLESWLKRRAGVKDSSHLLPGHGGALDRIDSIVFAAAIVYYYALLTGWL